MKQLLDSKDEINNAVKVDNVLSVASAGFTFVLGHYTELDFLSTWPAQVPELREGAMIAPLW